MKGMYMVNKQKIGKQLVVLLSIVVVSMFSFTGCMWWHYRVASPTIIEKKINTQQLTEGKRLSTQKDSLIISFSVDDIIAQTKKEKKINTLELQSWLSELKEENTWVSLSQFGDGYVHELHRILYEILKDGKVRIYDIKKQGLINQYEFYYYKGKQGEEGSFLINEKTFFVYLFILV